MEKKLHYSSQEMLKEVYDREIKGMFDDETSYRLNEEIEKHMEEFDADERQRAAKSIEDAKKLYITH